MAVDPHKHCPICGTPIPLDELVCSQTCEKVWNQRLAQQKKSRYILLGILAVFIIIWVIVMYLR